ncbi:HlyD family efflux transporter periplasmic adaptor subunit [Bradyrhizobium sp. 141]|uniref:HlyD family secretion protein n=1 Tax=Bradyrhizobium sp. 141 TaxID=2782617 RepID=UPI001FFB7722|nr:HlyD family efflux transporter periplasmic adaptor subunit [Bradyrhizobium sp. 141]MCK1718277.1 HlyD family efflux transporter periplasmic adaptor subunit [Bradyrhizobium sp. 141]
MRLARVVIGLALLAGGLYILIGEHFAGTSADATINARLYVVRAPIEGRVTLAVRSIGARVNPGELVADITDERFDTARLLNLERDRDNQQIELKRIAEQRAALSQARTGFDAQSIDYQRGRIRQIEARIAETRAAQDAAAARLRQADADFKRANELNVRGVQTVANLDRARATYDVAQQDVVSAQQRINYFETELVSARDGVFIGESYNDAPFSTQRIRELDLRLAELSVEEQQVKARTAQFDRQIDAERLRVNRLTSAALNARVPGVAWDFLVDDGEFARRGQDLVKVVDCNSLIVTAGVSEALYDSLSIGAPAQFRLFGDERIFDGTITRLGGSGASSLYANLAVGPSPQHLQRFDVTVTIPELAEHPDLGCAIGRTGRVIFSSGPIARLRRLLTRYGV